MKIEEVLKYALDALETDDWKKKLEASHQIRTLLKDDRFTRGFMPMDHIGAKITHRGLEIDMNRKPSII